MSALGMDEPSDDTIFLNRSALYLPNPDNPALRAVDLASRLAEIRKL